MNLISKNASIIVIPSLVVALAFAPLSWADRGHHGKSDWAKVTRVEPITRTIEQRIPVEECWVEQVRYTEPMGGESSYTGTIIGGIIGGALGNAVGHRSQNKKIGTVVGTVLGASVGHDLSGRSQVSAGSQVSYRDEQRCEVEHKVSYEEQVIGYHVWYRYHGDEYRTRMDHHPGDKIRVRVDVDPY